MIVSVDRPLRTRTQTLGPGDFADIVPCESVEWDRSGALLVVFGVDLTPAQRLAVQLRCISVDAAEESILTAAAQAYRNNQTFLAIPVPTTAQNLTQVAALTRQVQGLLRYVTRMQEAAGTPAASNR